MKVEEGFVPGGFCLPAGIGIQEILRSAAKSERRAQLRCQVGNPSLGWQAGKGQ